MTSARKTNRKHPGGRPCKFNSPSRPVTVTLPERTLAQLTCIHDDRAMAIVKAVEAATATDPQRPPVDIVEVARGIGLIVVGPSRALRTIPWLKMFEITPARYILSITAGISLDSLEIALVDLVEIHNGFTPEDRILVESLLKRVRGLRRRKEVSRSEILLVDLSGGYR